MVYARVYNKPSMAKNTWSDLKFQVAVFFFDIVGFLLYLLAGFDFLVFVFKVKYCKLLRLIFFSKSMVMVMLLLIENKIGKHEITVTFFYKVSHFC